MSAASGIGSRLGLGRLAYRTIFRPMALLRQSIREGGPIEQRRTAIGHAAMRQAALELPTLALPAAGPDAEIAFLSGPSYWHQTLFCFVSLQLHVPFRVTPVVYDDGQMDSETKARLLRVVPWMHFVDAAESEARLDALLPEGRYPSLRGRRLVYPHLRKLVDIHVGSHCLRLVADSDMLFFRLPGEVVAWFGAPRPFYMQDCETAYGYPLPFLSDLVGAQVPEPVNVGLYAIDGPIIDWDCVEHWCRAQLETYGPQYVQEQALTAMLFAGRPALALPRETYVVMPDRPEGENPTAILHHYVDTSKHSYFRYGWRRIAELARQSSQCHANDIARRDNWPDKERRA